MGGSMSNRRLELGKTLKGPDAGNLRSMLLFYEMGFEKAPLMADIVLTALAAKKDPEWFAAHNAAFLIDDAGIRFETGYFTATVAELKSEPCLKRLAAEARTQMAAEGLHAWDRDSVTVELVPQGLDQLIAWKGHLDGSEGVELHLDLNALRELAAED